MLKRKSTSFALLLILAAWTSLWFMTSNRFDKQIDAWVAAEKKAKHELTFDKSRLGGSPFSVSRSFTGVRWSDRKGASANIENLTLSIRPWCWRSLTAEFQKASAATPYFPDSAGPLTFHANRGEIKTIKNGEGRWTDLTISFADFSLTRAEKELSASETLNLEAERADPPPKDHQKEGMTLRGTVRNMKMITEKPLPFGDTIERAEISARIMGAPPEFTKSSVANWNEASGVIEIDSFALKWEALELDAKGTLALAGNLQPEGAFSATVSNRENVMQALIATGWAALNDAEALRAALNLPPGEKQLFAHKKGAVPLSIQEGSLFIGPVRSVTMPQIPWPSK